MTSQTYAVDSDILILLQRARLESEFAKLGRLPIVVTAIVWDEVVKKSNRPKAVLDLENMLRVNAGGPVDFEPDSPEASVFAHLQ